jgi:hypothetical protein
MSLTNDYINNKIETYKINELDKNISELKLIEPSLSDDILKRIYIASVSIHQRKMQSNGHHFEMLISEILAQNCIKFKQQVTINSDGIIIGFNKKEKCHHIVDFVIFDIEESIINSHISNYIVLSTKTTCRERWTQDSWTTTLKPKLYILATLSNDYPLSSRFNENTHRKIITSKPKKRDGRTYKLDFSNLIDLLK